MFRNLFFQQHESLNASNKKLLTLSETLLEQIAKLADGTFKLENTVKPVEASIFFPQIKKAINHTQETVSITLDALNMLNERINLLIQLWSLTLLLDREKRFTHLTFNSFTEIMRLKATNTMIETLLGVITKENTDYVHKIEKAVVPARFASR